MHGRSDVCSAHAAHHAGTRCSRGPWAIHTLGALSAVFSQCSLLRMPIFRDSLCVRRTRRLFYWYIRVPLFSYRFVIVERTCLRTYLQSQQSVEDCVRQCFIWLALTIAKCTMHSDRTAAMFYVGVLDGSQSLGPGCLRARVVTLSHRGFLFAARRCMA